MKRTRQYNTEDIVGALTVKMVKAYTAVSWEYIEAMITVERGFEDNADKRRETLFKNLGSDTGALHEAYEQFVKISANGELAARLNADHIGNFDLKGKSPK